MFMDVALMFFVNIRHFYTLVKVLWLKLYLRSNI